MGELVEDLRPVEQACNEVFALRRTHRWPPTLTIEPGWRPTYAALAAELAFPVTGVDEAVARVQALIDAIHAATVIRGH